MLNSALTILAVAGTLFAQGGGPSEPVATVDGQAIERQEFDRWMTIAAKATFATVPDAETGYRRCIAAKRKATPAKDRRKATDKRLKAQCRQEYAQMRDQVMQLLISFRWIEGEAAAQGIMLTDAEVTQSFDKQKRESFPKEGDFRKFIEESGQTVEDILLRVRLDLLSNKIQDKVVAGKDQISDEELRQFYIANRARFAEPEKRALRVVLTKRKAEALQARAALERGESWKAVASRYSIDRVSKRHGGKVRAQAKGALEHELDLAVFRAAKHRLVGPIRTDYGYYVFTVTKVVPARQPRFAEVRELIKQTLASQAEQAALDAFVQDFTMRWREKTECAEGYRTSDCRNGPAPEGPRRT